MEWIEARIAERDQLEQTRRKIDKGADSIWEALYDGFKRCVDFYNEQMENSKVTLKPEISDRQGDRFAVNLMLHKPYEQPISRGSVKVQIDRKKRLIIVDGLGKVGGRVTLLMDLNSSGQLCIKRDGQEMSIEEVAREILDPLLFYDLQDIPERDAPRVRVLGG
jgi:hypothetical protein